MFEFVGLAGFIILAALGIYIIFKGNERIINLIVGLWLFSTAAWSLGQMFMVISTPIDDVLIPIQLSFLGIFWMGSFTLHLALSYPMKRNILEKKTFLFVLYFPAVLFSLLILTNNYHSLFISRLQYNPDSLLHYTLSYGLIGHIGKIVPYFFIILSVVLFSYSVVKSEGRIKKGTFLICLGLFTGLFSSVLSEFKIWPATTLFPISGLFFVVATLRYKMMIITPTTAAENILKTMNDALILTDVKNKILRINDSVTNILGFTEKDLISTTISSLFDNTNNLIQSTEFQQLKQGQHINNYTDNIITKKGDSITVSINASSIQDPDGLVKGYVYNIRDITKQKIVEERLRQSKKDLEKINLKLKQRKNEVENLLKQKDEFIHLLAHDLKNPLTTPLSLLPIIIKKCENEDTKKMANMSLKSISNIRRIIDETLQMARYEDSAKGLNLKKISITDLVKRVIENNANLIEQNQFSINTNIEDNLTINVDEFQLEEVFNNLISNAIKYTPEDSKGIITINAKTQNDGILISVDDNGIGLTEEQQKRVFEKFYKSAKPRKGMASTGLGLSICKNIIEHHGGSMRVESQGLGKGSTFSFSLPNHPNNNETNQQKTSKQSIEQTIDQLLEI